MPQINTPTIRHLAPEPSAGWQWLPFHDPTYRICILHALRILGGRLTGPERCRAAFCALPSGRSFADVFGDPAIWISYDPGNLAGRFGASVANEVTISQYACRTGTRVVAATLIRELIRADGAAPPALDQEQALMRDLLQRNYDPVIASRLAQDRRELEASARCPTLLGWS